MVTVARTVNAPTMKRKPTVTTDAQVHVWEHSLPGQLPHREQPLRHDELITMMDEAGVARAVVVPPSWAADGNAAALAAADAYPLRLAVMGVASLDRLAPERLLRWQSRRGLLGLRQPFHRQPFTGWLSDGTVDWVWRTASEAAIPVMVYPPGSLDYFDRIARKYPDLRLIIDHMGLPLPMPGTDIRETVTELVRLAVHENVGVKLSALPLYSHASFPFSDLHDSVRTVISAFGPHRTFWGSDFTRLSCSYKEAVAMMDTVDCLSDDDRAMVMGGALGAWLGWPDGD